MKRHRFASHTPEENRRLSDLGHIIEGVLLGAVGLLALLGRGGLSAWASTAWPVLLLVAGTVLLLLLYSLHPLADWPAIWRDAQQRQHTLMAGALALAGAAELLRGASPVLAYVWPGAAVFIGVAFLVHAQHGTSEAAAKAVRLHRLLGLSVIIAGLLRAGEVLTSAESLAVLWPLALLIASAQLIAYREPEGAYESEHGGHGA